MTQAHTQLPPSARLKLDLMFHGIHYTEALGRAATHAFPNYYPYRFQPGEPDPTGKGKAAIPYALNLADGTVIRIKGSGDSPWGVSGDQETGYTLARDGEPGMPVSFVPLPRWMAAQTSDGFPMARTGLELLGDLGVINLAPGCEYFLHKQDGVSILQWDGLLPPDAASKCQTGVVINQSREGRSPR
jgi:hypothetical protein